MHCHMTNIEFGKWLDSELKKRDWSKSDLSRKSGVSPSQISRLIKGERGVRDETLYALALALKVAPEKVFLIAIGQYDEDKRDQWVEDTSYKIKLVPSVLRGLVNGVIDSAIRGEENNGQAKPKPAKRGAK
jgi:transcriptional regulator with XRE-family HTH domain